MNREQISITLQEHKDWIDDKTKGKQADLRGADLQRADLQGVNLQRADLQRADLREADLRGTNLRGADLQRVDLREADLQRADLRGADLQGINLRRADLQRADLRDTILDGINWLAWIGITSNKRGVAYAYKLTNIKGEGVFNGGINYLGGKRFSVNKVDVNTNIQCSYGINLATFQWCLNNRERETDRLFLFEFKFEDAICPIASDGKFRVKKCIKVSECDWKGNLVSA